ncbi:MAG: type II toxin-antitoxin system RelE/ParE family toxin [Deltaproteobacteria bacterium]|nr:type II toxin-antitoxin system RelE/ParE family toxin [Deltaproteobacteria bacterium]
MIRSFRCPETERIFRRERSGKLPLDIQKTALRKLLMIHAAVSLDDLRVPPNNQLEALERDREGQHSIRINRQWRVCFAWKDGAAEGVEIVDYH